MSGICEFWPFLFSVLIEWWLMHDRVFKSNAAAEEEEGDAIDEER